MQPLVALLITLPAQIARYFAWFGPLAARIAIGFVFVASGCIKLFGTPDMLEAIQQLGVPFTRDGSPVTAIAAIACGGLLIGGLLTRVAAGVLMGGMVYRIVGIGIAQMDDPIVWYQWLNTVLGFTSMEYFAVLLWLAIAGAGPVSLDRALAGRPASALLQTWSPQSIAWVGPLVARFVVGYVFMWAGWGKLTDLPNFIQKFTEWGIPFPQILTPFASGTEFVGGILLMLGLLTRITGVALLLVSLVAIVSAKLSSLDISMGWYTWATGFFNFDESLYMVLCGWLAIAGAGIVSLDALLQRSTRTRRASPTRETYEHAAPVV